MLSVIVLSSDGYSDCWDPFFKLLKLNFEQIEEYEILLSTNNKDYKFNDLKIRTLTHGMIPWSERLYLSLDEAKNNTVLVIIEDFFLRSKLNFEIFEKLLKLMKTEESIDHIRLRYIEDKYDVVESKFEYIQKISKTTKNRFLFLPGLWKKKVLKKYIRKFEGPYMAEKMGNLRSYVIEDGFYSISNDVVNNYGQIYDCYGSGAIYKGKWNKWVVPFFKKHSIDIELSKRGIVDKKYEKKQRLNTKLGLINEPFSTIKSFLDLVYLYLNKKLKF